MYGASRVIKSVAETKRKARDWNIAYFRIVVPLINELFALWCKTYHIKSTPYILFSTTIHYKIYIYLIKLIQDCDKRIISKLFNNQSNPTHHFTIYKKTGGGFCHFSDFVLYNFFFLNYEISCTNYISATYIRLLKHFLIF